MRITEEERDKLVNMKARWHSLASVCYCRDDRDWDRGILCSACKGQKEIVERAKDMGLTERQFHMQQFQFGNL